MYFKQIYNLRQKHHGTIVVCWLLHHIISLHQRAESGSQDLHSVNIFELVLASTRVHIPIHFGTDRKINFQLSRYGRFQFRVEEIQ